MSNFVIAQNKDYPVMTPILNTTKLVEIFIECDDFCQKLHSHLLANDLHLEQVGTMAESEMMSIVIFYHHSGFKCFKYYYECIILGRLRSYFPAALSYSRFVNLMKKSQLSLFTFLACCRLAWATEGNFIDATKLVVCHNKRIKDHKVFKAFAKRGKSSTGWFFGFKLHAVINQYGQLVIFNFTKGNVADNNPDLLQNITKRLNGFLFGDAGYITSLKQKFSQRGLELITKLRGNMKPIDLTPLQKHYLRHRGLIEPVFNLMKNHCDIDHSRHRSPQNFLINLWSGLIAYSFLDTFPTMPMYIHKMSKSEIDKIVLI
jgi:hypothetical protein